MWGGGGDTFRFFLFPLSPSFFLTPPYFLERKVLAPKGRGRPPSVNIPGRPQQGRWVCGCLWFVLLRCIRVCRATAVSFVRFISLRFALALCVRPWSRAAVSLLCLLRLARRVGVGFGLLRPPWRWFRASVTLGRVGCCFWSPRAALFFSALRVLLVLAVRGGLVICCFVRRLALVDTGEKQKKVKNCDVYYFAST